MKPHAKSPLIFTVLAVMTTLAAIFFLNGCNTWHGAGKDVERAGEKMQEK